MPDRGGHARSIRTSTGPGRAGRTAVGASTRRRPRIGCGILPVGTHPWSSWQDQAVEDERARFRQMEDRYQRVARQQVICGCHVHVGIADPDLAVAVMSRVRPWLPVLLALSANSPFWSGEDTGYDSYRLEVWARWPTAGVPPDAGGPRRLRRGGRPAARPAGAIEDATHLYWYLRPSDRFPTLELRAMDVCLDRRRRRGHRRPGPGPGPRRGRCRRAGRSTALDAAPEMLGPRSGERPATALGERAGLARHAGARARRPTVVGELLDEGRRRPGRAG